MESQEFIVLYTHQKMKKSKVWQDGILKIPHIGNKAILYDDKGECLESLFLKCLKVKPGDDLESDRYLITVEEVQVAGSIALPQDVVKEAPDSNSRRCLPSGRTLGCRPAGLKRKFAGVQGPHQVPKKVVITEDGASAVSAEAKMCGPGFLSPFYSTPPLFSAGSVPTDRENTDTCRSGASSGRPSSAAASAPSGRTCPETLCEENHFCSPVSSVNKHSDSLLTNEPTKRASLASPCLGLSQSTRSKAQIVALLKSSAGVSEQVKPEATERFPQGQTQGGLKIATKPECFLEQVECAEVRKESLHDQRQSESTVKSGSQWAVRSSLQSSPVHSPAGGNNPERKPTAPGDRMNLHLEELLVQKEIQFFETCAENAEMSNEDKLVDNNYQSWGQKGTLEITSFCESNSPPVARGNVENDGSLSESDIQEDIKMPVKQNDQMCVEGSLLTREDAREANLCGSPGKGYKQAVSGLAGPERLQSVSLLREQSSISAAITGVFSTSDAAGGSLPTVHEPERHVTQPVLEVTFNLNNFETSDTEEESQESNAISQESGRWGQETLGNDRRPGVQRRCEDESREAIGSEHWLHLTSVGDKPAETFPVEETLPAQFCGQTRVGLDPGVWKAGNTGEEPEEDGGSDSALEWIGGPYNEDANKSVQKVGMNYDFASLPNQSKGKTSNLRLPQFLNMAPNQAPENSRTSERAQPQPSTMGSNAAKEEEQAFPTGLGSNDRAPPLRATHSHSDAYAAALDQSSPSVSSSLCCAGGRRHPVFRDRQACISESDHSGLGTAGESTQCRPAARNSSDLPGSGNNIALLKSLSEHSTALEGLEILRRRSTTSGQLGDVQTHELESSPGVGKQWISVVPRARPTSPHLNQDSQQYSSSMMIKENEVEASEPLQSLQFFSLGSEEETAFAAILPKQTERKACDPKPVEFQGHRVKGSASSAVMIRGQIPGGAACENCTPDICFLAPERPSTCMQADFLQVTSPEQKMSPVSPVSTVSLDSRDEDLVLELSADALKARTLPVMTQFSSVETKNFQRLPSVSRMRLPLITGPADVGPRSHTTGCDKWEASAAPTVVCEGATVPSFSFGPEDQSETRESREVTSADTSLLDHVSSQSKWLKYQNLPQCNSTAPSRADRKFTDGFLAEATSGPCSGDTGERHGNAVEGSQLGAVRLQVIKSVLRQQQLHFSGQGLLCRKQALSLNLKQTSKLEELPNLSGEPACYEHNVTGGAQEISGSELCFPSGQKIKSSHLPQRHVRIPAHFQSPAQYRQVFASCLREHLNILLFGLAQRLHKALSKVDISFYMSSKGEKLKNVESSVPSCHHHQPAKLVVVQKDGPNKGRLFYTCDAPKADRCKFFKWLEKETPGNLTQKESPASMVLSDIKSIGLYLRSQTIPLYEECQLLVRKGFDFQRKQSGKLKRFTTVHPGFYSEPNSKLYLKLSRKESSSTYSKDDLWVVSKTLDFELDTFIACSAFFGPSSTNELEILPLRGYCPSNWPTNTVVHALLVCNASTELTTLKNIEDHFNPATLPLTWHLLTLSSSATVSNKRVSKRKFIPPALSTIHTNLEVLSLGATLQIARELIRAHTLNLDQAAALTQIAHMMASHDSAEDKSGPPTRVPPITVIQGVFGAGKSYLLAVVILFFVQLFEKSEAPTVGNSRPWKVLISSSTNVAVDRVLLGLLSLGFEKFVRVGSVRKIAKPVLPYSLHAGSENASEQLKELHALMKEDLTPMERVYVRKSIEQHKLGTNRNLLKQVRVVGVTCAACPFPCMNDLKFPVVVLDECSQMTEPTALLPIARFECEKLILVGDPKQLPPTIQASEAAHENGLEQTLFDRLCLMGHKPVLLRTQYRCHPAISAVANDLFYAGNLRNGVSEAERGPLVAWLPTLCFYHVSGAEQIERGSSFHNAAEAAFTLKLIQSLIASGVAGSVIGVITLYKAQMYKLCHLLSAVDFDQPEVRAVQVSTVDAFQGAEKEIIILSCVRTRQVGFIDSEKRMNVALTRGRRHLLIVGNLACLRKNHLWGRVIQHCEGREDGLQHARQCEAQLDHLLRDYFEKQAEEKQKKKSEKDKCKD
ncbi:zinc finger GRF-type containing 1 [Rhinolophus ferrumequinum]|uniref:5'-3' DNA helicase ZGRF1 n=1 Tax=Rhinolophus ferrumequinum TaxID=59479 RepID=A0A7J7U3Q7_RHIFE|nr:zinc finger GRF-type containing 1 [Rhinolophus ferrumequinum]